jgi:glutaredoxin
MDSNNFEKPSEATQYTIYSKSGCPNCKKVKELLETKQIPFTIIDCDEYLLDNKESFLLFILNLTSQEWKTFPIVFNKNSRFIGGFLDTREYLEKLEQLEQLDFTDESF